MRALLLHVSKGPMVVELPEDGPDHMAAMYRHIDCTYFTIAPKLRDSSPQAKIFDQFTLWCDDEGLNEGKPVNFWSGYLGQMLAGNILITRNHGPETTGLSQADINALMKLFPKGPEPFITFIAFDASVEDRMMKPEK